MSKSGNLAQLAPIFSSNDAPTIYYAEDGPYLPRILIFYWPVQAVGSLSSASRVRTTILSAAGFKSFAAFSIAPSSSFYSAVHKLPDEKQRDDICRALAFALCRYFSEVPTEVKNAITEENLKEGPGLKWGQTHAAQVACKMTRVTNVQEVIDALRPFSKEQTTTPAVSAPMAAPAVRPLASIRKTRPSYLPQDISQNNSAFSRFTTPSKRIPSGTKRSPSASTAKKAAINAAHKQNTEQLEALRFKMCELVDTEDRYIGRLQELIDLVLSQGRTAKSISNKFTSSKSQKTVNAMLQFPSLLDQIKDLNLAFLDDVESVLQATEDQALNFIEQSPAQPSMAQPPPKDPIAIYAFAKVLLNHFPKFPVPYRSYLDLHAQISSNLDQFFKDDASSIQLAPSLLMEPAQRISRYSLYIDAMIPMIPTTSSLAIKTLEKARKIIAEICEMEPAASAILDSIRIEHEIKKRSLSPTKLISGLSSLNRANTTREAPAKTSSISGFATISSGSLRDRDGPRLLPSLSRSFSKKSRSRPGLAGILGETNPDQAQNRGPTQSHPQNDENARPKSSSSSNAPSGGALYNALSFGRRFRPDTSHSQSTNSSSPSRPGSKGRTLDDVAEHEQHQTQSSFNEDSAVDVSALDEERSRPRDRVSSGNIEHYRAQVMRLEQENYKLLAENAELKRLVRECRCRR